MKAKLCICNNCETIMIDQNPGEQPELEIPFDCKEMEFLEDEDGLFWGCPVCKTDGYFSDLFEV